MTWDARATLAQARRLSSRLCPGSYGRLSWNPTTHELEKTETQWADNRVTINRHAGVMGRELSDDLSAWKKDVRRTIFELLSERAALVCPTASRCGTWTGCSDSHVRPLAGGRPGLGFLRKDPTWVPGAGKDEDDRPNVPNAQLKRQREALRDEVQAVVDRVSDQSKIACVLSGRTWRTASALTCGPPSRSGQVGSGLSGLTWRNRQDQSLLTSG